MCRNHVRWGRTRRGLAARAMTVRLSTDRRLRILLIVLAVILLPVAGFLIWALTPDGPAPEAEGFLRSDGTVEVTTNGELVFRPKNIKPTTGLVFYPGAHVDPRSYAPLVYRIASAGHLVVIPQMPLNFAILAPNTAERVVARFPDVKHWAVGGHSLGGATAVKYAATHDVRGLVIFAATPPNDTDLSHRTDLLVTAVFGTGGIGAEAAAVAKPRLPENTTYVLITGGNHAQFGTYDPSSPEPPASISREEQQHQAADATIDLLNALADGSPRH